jgi:hypothetical protein
MSIYVSLLIRCLQLQRGTASRCVGAAESRLIRALPADRTWRETRMPFGFEELHSHVSPASLRARMAHQRPWRRRAGCRQMRQTVVKSGVKWLCKAFGRICYKDIPLVMIKIQKIYRNTK